MLGYPQAWVPPGLGTPSLEYPQAWVTPGLGNPSLEYPQPWVPPALGTPSLGYPMAWVPIGLGTPRLKWSPGKSCFDFKVRRQKLTLFMTSYYLLLERGLHLAGPR